jgi:DNA-binding transcriptional LysR family regulator
MQLSERIGRRLKLRDLNIFLIVAKERSMSKAATQLAIAQPAISKAIADIEYTLGAPLFDRGSRGRRADTVRPSPHPAKRRHFR